MKDLARRQPRRCKSVKAAARSIPESHQPPLDGPSAFTFTVPASITPDDDGTYYLELRQLRARPRGLSGSARTIFTLDLGRRRLSDAAGAPGAQSWAAPSG